VEETTEQLVLGILPVLQENDVDLQTEIFLQDLAYHTDELIKTDSKELVLDKLKFHYTEIDGYKILHKIDYDKGTYSITGDTHTNASEMEVFKGEDI